MQLKSNKIYEQIYMPFVHNLLVWSGNLSPGPAHKQNFSALFLPVFPSKGTRFIFVLVRLLHSILKAARN